MIIPPKKLVLIMHVLGLGLVFEDRKNRVSGGLFAFCLAGVQHYVFGKTCNEGGGF